MKLKPRLQKSDVDPLWAKAVKDRDEWRCQLCGKDCGKIGGHANAHHIAGKKSHVLRYSLDNGITLCQGDHIFGVHSDDGIVSHAAIEKIRRVVGEARWNRILALKASSEKLSLSEAYERLVAGQSGKI